MTIKIKRDTAANWTSVNPVLAVGQPGHDTTNNQIRVGNGSSAWTALTPISGGGVTDGDKGDITVSSGGTVWTIDAGAVTLADMADIATSTMIGRATAGTGAPEALTVAQVKTVLAYTPADIGAATSAQANATHTGDVTGATALTIATGVVSNAKLATMPANTIKGNNTGSVAAPADLTVAQTKTLLAYTASDLSLAAIATSGSAADLTSGLLPSAQFNNISHGSRAGGSLHAVATTSVDGFMSGADKTKLDGIAAGAQVNVATNLAYTAATRIMASSTGTSATLPLVTSTDAGLAPASGGGTTNFLRADGTWAAPAGGGGGGSTGGTATINFGAAPGTNLATLVVTGQGAITSTSRIKVWFQGGSTADFNEYEHLYILPSSVKLSAATIVNGVGFTIYATTQLRIRGNVVCRWEWS